MKMWNIWFKDGDLSILYHHEFHCKSYDISMMYFVHVPGCTFKAELAVHGDRVLEAQERLGIIN